MLNVHFLLRNIFRTLPEAEFLDKIQTKVLRIFLLAIHSHLYSFALRFAFLQANATSYDFNCSIAVHCEGERRKTC
jgi:hypothetical protein